MTFDEVLEQVRELLQSKGRVAYRALKRRFELDDEYLEDLKAELIDAEHVAHDEDSKVLVWVGREAKAESENRGTGETETGRAIHDPQTPTPDPRTLRRQTLDAAAERRQLTVMFCDLVGSTALSSQLDPEELREVVRAYQETCTEVIRRYDGHIAQHLGDGLLVYFGYPAAHEDDAQRAVRVGLEIITALQHLSPRHVPSPLVEQASSLHAARMAAPPEGQGEREKKRTLQVRIGIHTGLVVIGEIGSSEKREILALGETPNLAARIQGLAEPDTVVLSGATHRLVAGLFACRDLGLQLVKGLDTPMAMYQVIGEGPAQSRFEVAVRTGLTPLVGREEELALLRRRWRQATEGEGQIVLLSGEPGIGKSRLVQELKHEVTQDGAVRIEFRCSPYHQNSALYPLIEHAQRVLHFAPGDTPQEKLRKLEQTFSGYRFPQADTVPLLAALLSLPQPAGSPPLALSPQQQKQKTLDALVRWLFEESERAAVCTVWEDLHWADPSTLEFLAVCLDQVPTTRTLMVLTFRPEFTPMWASRSHLGHLVLSRLGRTQSSAIVEKLTGENALPAEVVHQIVAKTDGVPLFVEELTKSVVESNLGIGATGQSPLPLGIPATLQDALMARLDRLGAAKEIAQVGAVLGREFSYELLYAVSPVDDDTFQHGLRQLVAAELVYQSGLPPQARYLFKHALVRETAYQSLLKSRRQQLHHQVAQVLEEKFPQTVETQPELIAHHYTEAGLGEQAIPYWRQAGYRAAQRSANLESISHLTKGLELLKTLLDTPERAQQELTLQIALGSSLMTTKGYGASEVEQVYTRARELCQQIGETPQLFSVLRGLWVFYELRAELQMAHRLEEQLLSLAQSVQAPAFLLEAHFAWGQTSLFLGEFAPALEHLERGIALYDSQQHRSHAFLYGQDPGVFCLALAAWALWFLGYPDRALKRSQEALLLAQRLAHPNSLGAACVMTAQVHHYRREVHIVQERAEAAIAFATEQGLPNWVVGGAVLRGWALPEQERTEEGIAQMDQSIGALKAIGADLIWPYHLALQAQADGKRGRHEEGLTKLAEVLAIVHKNGERYFEAELYRLKGGLLLAQEGYRLQAVGHREKTEEAEECFLKAIEIARRQQAKSWELRAAMSLAKLWQQQSKQKEAHEMLAEIYGWFTEGFDTKDLQDAKALLAELEGP